MLNQQQGNYVELGSPKTKGNKEGIRCASSSRNEQDVDDEVIELTESKELKNTELLNQDSVASHHDGQPLTNEQPLTSDVLEQSEISETQCKQ